MNTTAPLSLMALLLALLPAGPLMAAATSAPTTIDPTSELAPPPFEITGPEDLGDAIEKARSIEHPDYKESIRYRRTTHISFPLPKIDSPEDMSRVSVPGALDSVPASTETASPIASQPLLPGTTAARQEPGAGHTSGPQPAPMLIQGNTRGWSSLSVVNN
jgi:hypothetical protein